MIYFIIQVFDLFFPETGRYDLIIYLSLISELFNSFCMFSFSL